MLDTKEYKEARMIELEGEQMSSFTYNLIIGIVLFYGFALNALIVNTCTDWALTLNPIALLIGYLILTISGVVIVHKSPSPFISFAGYNLIVAPIGILLCFIVYEANLADPSIVLKAVLITGIATIFMMLVASIFPRFFAKIGAGLFIAFLSVFIGELVLSLFGFRPAIFDFVMAGIFSLYIGYDWSRAQRYWRNWDNAIDSAADIYVDVINLFVRILSILSRNNR